MFTNGVMTEMQKTLLALLKGWQSPCATAGGTSHKFEGMGVNFGSVVASQLKTWLLL